MQLYKSRTFGDYFSDTFTFLRENGKHFYKNYFIINGILIIILLVMMFFFSRFYTNVIFSDTFGDGGNSLTNYLDQNLGVLVIFGFLFVIIALLLGIVNYAYTPLYFLLYEKNKGSDFSKNDIVDALKSNLGKIFTFLLAGILIAIPLFMALGLIIVILTITIIGIPLLLIAVAWLSQFYYIAFITYLQTNKGVFECFSYGFNLSFKNFWAANGCVALFYIMIQVVQGIVTLIPYSFAMGSLVLGAEEASNMNTTDQSMTIITMLTAVYMVAFFVNIILTTILQMNQSIIFFSLKEDTENINTKSEIDEIGSY
ncbi:hypothetical protein [Joostella sp.]|uniref:hypothetical protein n=1 Tax=Joostella sp. TaxID=2231138 RepID=UPI003A948FC4